MNHPISAIVTMPMSDSDDPNNEDFPAFQYSRYSTPEVGTGWASATESNESLLFDTSAAMAYTSRRQRRRSSEPSLSTFRRRPGRPSPPSVADRGQPMTSRSSMFYHRRHDPMVGGRQRSLSMDWIRENARDIDRDHPQIAPLFSVHLNKAAVLRIQHQQLQQQLQQQQELEQQQTTAGNENSNPSSIASNDRKRDERKSEVNSWHDSPQSRNDQEATEVWSDDQLDTIRTETSTKSRSIGVVRMNRAATLRQEMAARSRPESPAGSSSGSETDIPDTFGSDGAMTRHQSEPSLSSRKGHNGVNGVGVGNADNYDDEFDDYEGGGQKVDSPQLTDTTLLLKAFGSSSRSPLKSNGLRKPNEINRFRKLLIDPKPSEKFANLPSIPPAKPRTVARFVPKNAKFKPGQVSSQNLIRLSDIDADDDADDERQTIGATKIDTKPKIVQKDRRKPPERSFRSSNQVRSTAETLTAKPEKSQKSFGKRPKAADQNNSPTKSKLRKSSEKIDIDQKSNVGGAKPPKVPQHPPFSRLSKRSNFNAIKSSSTTDLIPRKSPNVRRKFADISSSQPPSKAASTSDLGSMSDLGDFNDERIQSRSVAKSFSVASLLSKSTITERSEIKNRSRSRSQAKKPLKRAATQKSDVSSRSRSRSLVKQSSNPAKAQRSDVSSKSRSRSPVKQQQPSKPRSFLSSLARKLTPSSNTAPKLTAVIGNDDVTKTDSPAAQTANPAAKTESSPTKSASFTAKPLARRQLNVAADHHQRRISPSSRPEVTSKSIKPSSNNNNNNNSSSSSNNNGKKPSENQQQQREQSPKRDQPKETPISISNNQSIPSDTASITTEQGKARGFFSTLLRRKTSAASTVKSESQRSVIKPIDISNSTPASDGKDSGLASVDESNSSSGANSTTSSARDKNGHSGPNGALTSVGHRTTESDGKGLQPVPEDGESDAFSAGVSAGEERSEDEVSTLERKLNDYMTSEDISAKFLHACQKGQWNEVESMLRTVDKRALNLSIVDEHGLTPLMLAAKDNRINIIDKLIEFGTELEEMTKDARTVAHIAAMYARDETMRYLISKGIDIYKKAGPKHQSPLHMAAARPSGSALPMVQLLLRTAHSNGNFTEKLSEDANGCNALLLACETGTLSVVKELLSSQDDKQVRVRRKDTGDTALHFACQRRDAEMVKFLIAHGAQVNTQNNIGRTALHVVAAEGDEGLLRILYAQKADANIADKDDKTPLHIAAEKGYTSVVEVLADKFKASVLARTKDGSTLMHIASKFGHSDTALAFLKRGVPLHMPNKTGALGLHMAAALGHTPVVKALLAKGTPVNVKTKDNYTALHVAVQAGKADVVETLLGYGADVHVKGGKLAETALHVAAALDGANSRYCAEMLLKSGADPNTRLESGETALHIASRKGNTLMVQLLLSEGADATTTSKVGESPLHTSSMNCYYEVSKTLLEHVEHNRRREDAVNLVNLQTIEGETAVHYAAQITKDMCHIDDEDVKLLELLLNYGGEVNIQTQLTGEIALHYCCRSGNDAVLSTIISSVGAGGMQIILNKQDKRGWSPLMEACARGHYSIAKLLLQHHARVDVFDEHGTTALHLAAEYGHTDLCDLLLKNKAFINSKTKTGVTPLHLACTQGHSKVVTLLVHLHKASTDALTADARSALHLAAEAGQLSVCSTLISLGANLNSKDTKGQTPIHLAAESDHPDVVKLFLKLKPELTAATDDNGFTCAHIAAMKGSVAVVRELMLIDRNMVIEARTKTTDATALHMAAAGGHKNVLKILINAGASVTDENSNGMTALHLAARYGHASLLDVFDPGLWSKCSRKTGLNPLHVAAYFGQMDFVRATLAQVSATCRSEPPLNFNPFTTKELMQEYALTPLHMAAQSGHEGLVRMLLNQSGVQVDAPTASMGVIPLHLAAQSGHIAVVGLLLSRSTTQLHNKDSRGRTALHLAASQGHYEMVSLLIAQGSNINALDQNGWTSLHFATKAGHTHVVKLLLESRADPMAETRDGKVALCFAASNNHANALSHLLQHSHDTHLLMEDRKFMYDLMVCSKSHGNKPLKEFILLSPAPIDTAVKMSSLYSLLASKEKERARDLTNAADYCQTTAVELLSIASVEYKPAMLLKAQDYRGRPFIDVLIENDQKEVVSHPAVQSYLTEVWSGGIYWGSGGKFALFLMVILLCPPAWVFFSLPFQFRVSEAPVIKFICHLVSHIYFSIVLILKTLCVLQPIYEVTSFMPHYLEWILLLWLSGLLVTELSHSGGRSGLFVIRLVIVFLGALGALTHVAAFAYPRFLMRNETDLERTRMMQTILYIKNQLFAFVLLLSFVLYLEFLTVHHLFGPWAIIIRDLMYDMTRFLVILFLFMAGFTLHIASIFKPAFREVDDESADLMELQNVWQSLELLFFSLFGLVQPDDMPPLHLVPDIGRVILKIVFGLYLMVILIVLINLLIAMMSDTYQRIQQQSDVEWKFGRAKLIRQMNKKSAVPAPVNMFTKCFTVLRVTWKHKGRIWNSRAQADIESEENLDAYSMRDAAGRLTPTLEATDVDSLNGRILSRNEEGGWLKERKLDSVINWKRIVELYNMYHGDFNNENEEGKEPDSNNLPNVVTKNETEKL